jgi:uncharacterized protein
MKKKYYILGALATLIVLVIVVRLFQVGNAGRDPSVKAEKDLYWGELATFNYVSGEVPKDLSAMNGKVVRIPGFVVPLSDNIKRMKEFLLVPNGMACIHAPPPPPNQMVMVTLKYDMDYELAYGPVWVTGELNIENVKSPFGDVGFQMDGKNVEPYKLR